MCIIQTYLFNVAFFYFFIIFFIIFIFIFFIISQREKKSDNRPKIKVCHPEHNESFVYFYFYS